MKKLAKYDLPNATGEQFISQCEYYLATHRTAEAVHLVRQTVCTKLLNKDCRTTDRLCEMVHDQLSKQLTSSNEEKREKAVLGLLDHLDVIFILAQTRTEFGTLLEENKLIEKVLQGGNVGDIQCLIKRFPDPTTFQSSLVIKASGLDCIPLVYKAIEDYSLLTNRAAISLCYVLLSKEEVAAVMEVLSCHSESRVLFNVVKKMWRLGWKEEVRVIVEEVEEGEKRRGLEEMVEGLEVPKE